MPQKSLKLKAPNPHLRCQEVGPGEAGDRRYPQGGSATMVAQQDPGGPRPWISFSKDLLANPGQSFM